jgi:hypothetical protein
MGVDFVAVMGHNLEGDRLFTIPELLNSRWSLAEPFLPVLEGYPVPGAALTEWRWDSAGWLTVHEMLQEMGMINIEGPDCFFGSVGRRAIELSHLVRWRSFLTDDSLETKLRGICRSIAETLGSPSIAYVPGPLSSSSVVISSQRRNLESISKNERPNGFVTGKADVIL